jgi:elongation factor P--beta-lysine ligase
MGGCSPRCRRAFPTARGVALGFDRLVMIAAGKTNIDDVLAFTVEHA